MKYLANMVAAGVILMVITSSYAGGNSDDEISNPRFHIHLDMERNNPLCGQVLALRNAHGGDQFATDDRFQLARIAGVTFPTWTLADEHAASKLFSVVLRIKAEDSGGSDTERYKKVEESYSNYRANEDLKFWYSEPIEYDSIPGKERLLIVGVGGATLDLVSKKYDKFYVVGEDLSYLSTWPKSSIGWVFFLDGRPLLTSGFERHGVDISQPGRTLYKGGFRKTYDLICVIFDRKTK